MTESNIQQLCRIAASDMGALVFRNNVGAYKDKYGNYIKYGVCNPGGSDLIGIYNGKFLAMEVKKPGEDPTDPQINFLTQVHKAGGIAGVVRSPYDVKKLLTTCALLL